MLMHLAMVCSDDPVHAADEVILDGVGAYATLRGQGAPKPTHNSARARSTWRNCRTPPMLM